MGFYQDIDYKLVCVTNRHLVNGDFYLQIQNILKSQFKPDMLVLRENIQNRINNQRSKDFGCHQVGYRIDSHRFQSLYLFRNLHTSDFGGNITPDFTGQNQTDNR